MSKLLKILGIAVPALAAGAILYYKGYDAGMEEMKGIYLPCVDGQAELIQSEGKMNEAYAKIILEQDNLCKNSLEFQTPKDRAKLDNLYKDLSNQLLEVQKVREKLEKLKQQYQK